MLLSLGQWVYQTITANELTALQQRLLSAVTSLASGIDGEAIRQVAPDTTEPGPMHQAIGARFSRVIASDPDIESIYILRPTAEPTKLRFFVDVARDDIVGAPGEIYDATDVPVLIQGFSKESVETEPYADEFGLSLSGYAPIFDEAGRSVAIVGIDVHASRLDAIKREILQFVLVGFGLSVLLLGLVSMIVAHNVRAPLSRIIEAATAISRGRLDTRVKLRRHDELGVLSNQIDAMAQQLQQREFIRETFGRYVSEEVANALLTQPSALALGGEERVVTVLLSDLRGYATLSEQMPPGEVVRMLNEYFGEMQRIIDRHRGCVIEFLGDAILIVFGAPCYRPDHAERAVACAIDMRDRLIALNEEWEQGQIARYRKWGRGTLLAARMGIHSGTVIAGNLGSPSRMKYAVIGDTVNVAARLEELNKSFGSDILISHEVYAHLPEELISRIQDQGEHLIRGREHTVSVYSVR